MNNLENLTKELNDSSANLKKAIVAIRVLQTEIAGNEQKIRQLNSELESKQRQIDFLLGHDRV